MTAEARDQQYASPAEHLIHCCQTETRMLPLLFLLEESPLYSLGKQEKLLHSGHMGRMRKDKEGAVAVFPKVNLPGIASNARAWKLLRLQALALTKPSWHSHGPVMQESKDLTSCVAAFHAVKSGSQTHQVSHTGQLGTGGAHLFSTLQAEPPIDSMC